MPELLKMEKKSNGVTVLHRLWADQAILVDVESQQEQNNNELKKVLLDQKKNHQKQEPHGNNDEICNEIKKRLTAPTAMFGYVFGLLVPLFVSFNTVLLELLIHYLDNKITNFSLPFTTTGSTSPLNTVEWYYLFTAVVLFTQYLTYKLCFLGRNVSGALASSSALVNKTNDVNEAEELIDNIEGSLEIKWHVCTFLGMMSSFSLISWFIDHSKALTTKDSNGGLTIVITLSTFVNSGVLLTTFYVTMMVCMCCYLVQQRKKKSTTKTVSNNDEKQELYVLLTEE